MASHFEIHAQRHWSFRLVLLGSRLQLEGCREAIDPEENSLLCSTWLEPLDTPLDRAYELIAHPSCCL
jgi:hypothetical protein